MKILSINNFTPIYQKNNNQKASNEDRLSCTSNPEERKLFAYQDFNIKFTGRTPEDFYAQDFNRNNMPKTMLEYLDTDYYQRQHIPPEQMMREVFKYLNNAKNFGQVKDLYPNEDLFKDLHPNNIKSKKGILPEIKVARELSDVPLLKDGNDNFGMYLLKKIYTEGKTLKEISKDFLEKDINEEYKGFVTAPVEYSTLSAYGIKYPKGAFWHSFIATRDEYKKFFVENMPKYNLEGNNSVSGSGVSSRSKVEQDELSPRPVVQKHIMKEHRRKEITKDIVDINGDLEQIKKVVVKRFRKDDPEASFIVKYMSPIMTVAAQRAHLSEEMKIFHEMEQEKGPIGKGKTMFERFWKANPQTLHLFSNAITDTISMFENVYESGGMIGINSEFERITKDSQNQKPIDFVNEEFYELVQYSKQIEPERERRYIQHDLVQKELEELLGQKENRGVEYEIKPTVQYSEPIGPLTPLEHAKKLVEQTEGAKLYEINVKNGNNIIFVNNIDKTIKGLIESESKIFPRKFASAYVKYATKDAEYSDRYKLTKALMGYIENEEDLKLFDNIDDPQIMSLAEYRKEALGTANRFCELNENEFLAASFAMIDTIAKYNKNVPDDWFSYGVFDYYANVYSQDFETSRDILIKNRDFMDNLYNSYMKPFDAHEASKIASQIMRNLMAYDYNSPDSRIDSTTRTLMKMIKETCEGNDERTKLVKGYFERLLLACPAAKVLCSKNLTKEQQLARFEFLITPIIADDVLSNISPLYALVPEYTFAKYITQLPKSVGNRVSEHRKAIFKDLKFRADNFNTM